VLHRAFAILLSSFVYLNRTAMHMGVALREQASVDYCTGFRDQFARKIHNESYMHSLNHDICLKRLLVMLK